MSTFSQKHLKFRSDISFFCDSYELYTMCTVSYLPLSEGNYLLTSNRDEQTTRERALPIQQYRMGDRTVYYPKDPEAGGTWIATTGKDRTVCLLNGDSINTIRPLPSDHYRKSRGLIVLDYFHCTDLKDFLKRVDLDGIAPFTLVVLENDKAGQLHLCQLTWNGTESLVTTLDTHQPKIWSSSTLYSPEKRAKREQWFQKWLHDNPTYTQSGILDFHEFTGEGNPEEDLLMRNEILQTVSICSIERMKEVTHIVYKDIPTKETITCVVGA